MASCDECQKSGPPPTSYGATDAHVSQNGTSGDAAPSRQCNPLYPGYGATAAVNIQPQAVTVVVARPAPLKSITEAYLLWFPLGLIGLHHFYLRRYAFGVLYLFTLGLLGVGWLVDGFRIPCLVRDANRRIKRKLDTRRCDDDADDKHVSLCDAYILWFPLGLIGLHHYYLRRPVWGVAYTFTLGLFGIGWLVDAFRMPCLVNEANERLAHENRVPHMKSLGSAYALGLTPAGLFGAHHFYLGNIAFGVYYMLTLGGFGVGWITDWFRMPLLVKRANNPNEHLLGDRHKYVDDAYVMAFPAGFLGLHHFYLERPCWGVLYLFTLGLCGVGWLVDLCRMPCLVADTNKRLEAEAAMMYEVREQIGGACVITNRADVLCYPQPPPAYPPPQELVVGDAEKSKMVFEAPTTESGQLTITQNPPPYSERSFEATSLPTAPAPDHPPAYTGLEEPEKKPL
jgi:TM2 domain-containing membrane protein YozV